MKRIICIGNRYIPEDAAGYEVYRYLVKKELPEDVELIDGGLAGLDLLRLIEGMEKVVFVDAMSGFCDPGEMKLLKAGEVAGLADNSFNHSSGLPYLLGVLPLVGDGIMPEIFVVGIEGVSGEETIKRASTLVLNTITGDTKEGCLNG